MNYELGSALSTGSASLFTHEIAPNYSVPYRKFEQKTLTVQKFIFIHFYNTARIEDNTYEIKNILIHKRCSEIDFHMPIVIMVLQMFLEVPRS